MIGENQLLVLSVSDCHTSGFRTLLHTGQGLSRRLLEAVAAGLTVPLTMSWSVKVDACGISMWRAFVAVA